MDLDVLFGSEVMEATDISGLSCRFHTTQETRYLQEEEMMPDELQIRIIKSFPLLDISLII